MSQRLECYIRCKKCDVTVGKVMAKQTVNPIVWEHVPVPKNMPKKCKLCDSILERVEP